MAVIAVSWQICEPHLQIELCKLASHQFNQISRTDHITYLMHPMCPLFQLSINPCLDIITAIISPKRRKSIVPK